MRGGVWSGWWVIGEGCRGCQRALVAGARLRPLFPLSAGRRTCVLTYGVAAAAENQPCIFPRTAEGRGGGWGDLHRLYYLKSRHAKHILKLVLIRNKTALRETAADLTSAARITRRGEGLQLLGPGGEGRKQGGEGGCPRALVRVVSGVPFPRHPGRLRGAETHQTRSRRSLQEHPSDPRRVFDPVMCDV